LKHFIIDDKHYHLSEVYQILQDRSQLSLSDTVISNLNKSRDVLENLVSQGKTIYGVNTGFGKLSQVKIEQDEIVQLQENLILSHAVGVGKPVQDNIVKLMMILKIISFSKGNSGVRPLVVEGLINLINNDILPIVPSQGSVGASGDLAPLAHMTLPLLGLGNVKHNGKIIKAKDALQKVSLSPIELSYKEGLALINGTQFSTAYGVLNAYHIDSLVTIADICGAMSLEGLKGSSKPFEQKIHKIKPHLGQIECAENLITLLQNSEINNSHKNCSRVQDMYSLRCMPQVHGASREVLKTFRQIIETEVNSVSDNPLVFVEENDVVSAGQFHAEAVGQAMDIAAIALTELGTISERRIYTLVNGEFDLPPFLVENPGVNSGFMILQVTSASIASENKTLSMPSTVDSIPTGAGQEDHVSMAPWAGRKLWMIVQNIQKIFAIEMLSSCQAIDFRNGLKPAKLLQPVYDKIRENVEYLSTDRLMQEDINLVVKLIEEGKITGLINHKLIGINYD
jgi:histidine ammonia-lyase